MLLDLRSKVNLWTMLSVNFSHFLIFLFENARTNLMASFVFKKDIQNGGDFLSSHSTFMFAV